MTNSRLHGVERSSIQISDRACGVSHRQSSQNHQRRAHSVKSQTKASRDPSQPGMVTADSGCSIFDTATRFKPHCFAIGEGSACSFDIIPVRFRLTLTQTLTGYCKPRRCWNYSVAQMVATPTVLPSWGLGQARLTCQSQLIHMRF